MSELINSIKKIFNCCDDDSTVKSVNKKSKKSNHKLVTHSIRKEKTKILLTGGID